MTSMGMVEVPIHQIVDMVAMRNGGVAAIGPVHVGRMVAIAKMGWRAFGRILG